MTVAPQHPAPDNLELIGRHDINDFEAIMSVVGHEDPEGVHPVADNCEAIFTWDYEKGRRAKLDKLYEKAKNAQWNGRTDLPWDTPGRPGEARGHQPREPARRQPHQHQPRRHRPGALERAGSGSSSTSRTRTGCSPSSCTASRAPCCAPPRSSRRCPWIDAKYYAATQVVDEARHVEVFSRYLDEKLSGHYAVNGHLKNLLDEIIADSRWDMTYLGMQIMVEGLALAAFGFLHQLTDEPLLKQMLRYVMADEARHVAFGVLSLQELYTELSAAELRERQEFAFEAAVRMRDRMQMQELWERLDVPTGDVIKLVQQAPDRADFQILLFSKIIPNCKKLGLLDAGDGWLRQKFTEMGVIEFENLADTAEEADAAADGSPVERMVS